MLTMCHGQRHRPEATSVKRGTATGRNGIFNEAVSRDFSRRDDEPTEYFFSEFDN
jgi:hypothetical protein